MSISFTQIQKIAVLSALCTSLTLLAACSSDDDGDSGDTSVVDNPVVEPANEGETETPVVSETTVGAELVGSWVACLDGGGLRSEYEFDGANFSNRVGVGSCAGFETPDAVGTNAGTYEISGTTTTETGLTAFVTELTATSNSGFDIAPALVETLTWLTYVSASDELFFSNNFRFEDQDIPTELNLDIPYVRTQ